MRRPAPSLSVYAAWLAVPVLLATLVTACGAQPPPPPPLPRFATLAELGTAVDAQVRLDKTARVTMAGSINGPRQVTTSGDQQVRYDPAGISVELTQRVSESGAPVPSETTMIVLPDQAYLKPPAGSGLPLGKFWLKVPASSPDPEIQQVIEVIQAVRDSANMVRDLTQFGAAAAIIETAEDPVDGVRAQRYKIRLDLAKAALLQPDPATRQQMLQAASSTAASVDTTVWLDAQNRLVRLLIQQPLPGGGGIQTTDAKYHDWGQPVQINPPPPDQVIDN